MSGPLVGTGAVFRPAFNQPFVQFPFVGGAGPNLGLTGTPPISAPFVSTLGPASGESSRYGAAGNFPGIGSVYGSILPGVVLTTSVSPATPTQNPITVPSSFLFTPSYLADAPFINRLYGQSSFNTHTVGAKIRFTNPDNAFGIGVVPFYRFYLDKPDDLSGFNQLQRGSGPGSGFGDIGAVMFVDARLGRSANLSANIGYVLNSNPQSEAFGGADNVTCSTAGRTRRGTASEFPVKSVLQPMPK